MEPQVIQPQTGVAPPPGPLQSYRDQQAQASYAAPTAATRTAFEVQNPAFASGAPYTSQQTPVGSTANYPQQSGQQPSQQQGYSQPQQSQGRVSQQPPTTTRAPVYQPPGSAAAPGAQSSPQTPIPAQNPAVADHPLFRGRPVPQQPAPQQPAPQQPAPASPQREQPPSAGRMKTLQPLSPQYAGGSQSQPALAAAQQNQYANLAVSSQPQFPQPQQVAPQQQYVQQSATPISAQAGMTSPARQPQSQQQYAPLARPKFASKLSPTMLKYVAVGVAGLLALGVVAFMAFSFLSSRGGGVGALVSDTQDEIRFMRPEEWVQSTTKDQFIYFTDGGSEIKDTSRGILLGNDFIGIRYASLGDNDKETIRQSFETQFTSAEKLFASDSCPTVSGSKTTEQQRAGYDIAYLIEATCTRTNTDEPGGTVKMFIGWTDVNLHLFGVVADTATWEKSGDKLDQVIQSVQPAGS